MTGKNTAVFGIFQDRLAAEEAIRALRTEGFRSADVSCLFPDNPGSKDFAHEKQSKAPEGATSGGAVGAVAGGVFGWLVGLGALAIPGVGPFIAAGPIVAALAGLGVGGAVGGLAGGLIGMGIPEYEAKRYEGLIREGKVLVSVHCDNSEWIRKAKTILETKDGKDIASRSEASATISGTATNKPYSEERVL